MHYHITLRILGVLLVLFSTTMLPPLLVSLWYDDGIASAFLTSWLVVLVLGLVFWLPVRKDRSELRFRDGFLIVVLFWTVLSLVGALPLILSHGTQLSFANAIFESVSGLTTTGATVLVGIDALPRSILYYRQQLQWMGGMGIIVLAVAVMPMLGIGGMQLYRAETPGPVKDNKLTPRITETAKALWYVYLGLTVLCGVSYFLAGMEPFDAVAHAFSTVAIGGFSTHDASLAYFESNAINAIAALFMVICSVNFALHFGVIRSRRLSTYVRDYEARVFYAVMLGTILLVLLTLWLSSGLETHSDWISSIVQVVSVVTTTGFSTSGFAHWPTFLPMLLIMVATIGGCAGSTAGGIKVIRLILLYKQGQREIGRLIHPNAIMTIKLGGKPLHDNILNAVWGFLSLFSLSFGILFLMMLATGMNTLSALSSVMACLSNLGPGLGAVSQNYALVSDAGKLILSTAMMLGRLELFTLLVLFTRAYWIS